MSASILVLAFVFVFVGPVSQQAIFAKLNIHVRSNNAKPSTSTSTSTMWTTTDYRLYGRQTTGGSSQESLRDGVTTSSNFLCKAT